MATYFTVIKKKLTKTYDDLADYWGNDKTLHGWGQDDLKKFAKLTGKNAQVLDLGCASGYQSKMLCDLGLEVTGLDLSPEMIKVARRRVPEARFVVGDMTNMDFSEESFSGVYARASILHIPKSLVPKVLQGVHEILKRDGIFYLALKDGDGEEIVVDERHGIKVRRFFAFFNEDEIRKLLKTAGFKIKSVSYYQRAGGTINWIKIFAEKY